MDVDAVLDWCLREGKVMQIATVRAGQPWICTVYFVANEQRQLYWLSWPSRRHSQEIAAHPKVAVAIAAKTDLPVIGVQAEGTVEEVTDVAEVAAIIPDYIARYDEGRQFLDNFRKGTHRHHLYRFTPTRIVLLDEVHFAKNQHQEIVLAPNP